MTIRTRCPAQSVRAAQPRIQRAATTFGVPATDQTSVLVPLCSSTQTLIPSDALLTPWAKMYRNDRLPGSLGNAIGALRIVVVPSRSLLLARLPAAAPVTYASRPDGTVPGCIRTP